MTVISPWLFIAISYAWLLMTATLRLLLQCEENLRELTAEEEEKREGERTAEEEEKREGERTADLL